MMVVRLFVIMVGYHDATVVAESGWDGVCWSMRRCGAKVTQESFTSWHPSCYTIFIVVSIMMAISTGMERRKKPALIDFHSGRQRFLGQGKT